MKNKWIKILATLVLGITIFACKKSFLETEPQGVFSEVSLANAKGINTTIIAAYAQLDGWSDNGWNNAAGNPWPVAGSNWIWGSVTSDDAYPGSQPNDQPGVENANKYIFAPDDPYYRAKFQQCMQVLELLTLHCGYLITQKILLPQKKGNCQAKQNF